MMREQIGRPATPEMQRMRRGHLVNHIIPGLGRRRIGSLTKKDVIAWLADTKLSTKTRNHILDTLRIIFEEASDEGVLERNPLKSVQRFGGEKSARAVFSPHELVKMFPDDTAIAARQWGDMKWACLFAVLAQTGLRLGEALALEWRDIVYSPKGNPTLQVTKAVKNHKRRIGSTKNGRVRAVPILTISHIYLAKWRSHSEHADDSDLIFPNLEGCPLQGSVALTNFRKGLERIGISQTARNLVIHSLRHTFNTLYRAALEDEKLQRLTGHSSNAMTDNYDHPDIGTIVEGVETYLPTLKAGWDSLHKHRTAASPQLSLAGGHVDAVVEDSKEAC